MVKELTTSVHAFPGPADGWYVAVTALPGGARVGHGDQ